MTDKTTLAKIKGKLPSEVTLKDYADLVDALHHAAQSASDLLARAHGAISMMNEIKRELKAMPTEFRDSV